LGKNWILLIIPIYAHLQSNTLELDGKAQTLSYEYYYPYGGTALIAGKDKAQVQQKCCRYTGKERERVGSLSDFALGG
jgi:hypothetical protein